MADPGLVLKGQEVRIVCIQDGATVQELNSIAAFNDNVDLALQQQGYLGEPVNRFDEIHNGYGGDFEMHCNQAGWVNWQKAVIARAQRASPDIKFNVVRVDIFANGDSLVFTYLDVKWGAQPTSIGSRADKVKVKASFGCSERPVAVNATI